MPKYRVHLFPVMRVVYEVKTRTPRQAIRQAEALLTDETWRCAIEVDYAGDPTTEVIVDRCGPSVFEVLRDQFYSLVPVEPKRARREDRVSRIRHPSPLPHDRSKGGG